MLSPLWSHYYTEEMLNNISIEGDVPKKGYIPNKDRSTTSIKEALKAAGFDLRKLNTTRSPHPIVIGYKYVRERNPDTFLVFNSQESISQSLSTEIKKGVRIHVTDFDQAKVRLSRLKYQISLGWLGNKGWSYFQLRDAFLLEKQILHWQDPNKTINEKALKKEIAAKLPRQTSELLQKQLSYQNYGIQKRLHQKKRSTASEHVISSYTI